MVKSTRISRILNISLFFVWIIKFQYWRFVNPSLVGGGRKVVTPNFQSLIALKWNIWWFPTCCTLGHIYTLCILGPQKISKFSLYLSYSLVTKWTKYSYQTRVKTLFKVHNLIFGGKTTFQSSQKWYLLWLNIRIHSNFQCFHLSLKV